jgi:ABC-2 type transport system permease protein
MSVRGLMAVASVESSKILGQLKVRIVLAACVIGPLVFAAAMRVQSTLPEDTLFGRAVKESGLAVPLVILGFAALWAFPAVTSIVGGDVFSAEDRYGTWKNVLTRSRSRQELFAGKVFIALAFSVVAVTTLAVSSVAAGLVVIGFQPVIDLSGSLLTPGQGLVRVVLAWMSVLPPVFAFTALAVMLSIATRSSTAGIGLPVIAALTMQLYALVDGPEVARRLLITSAFGSWHGLLTEPPYYRPLIDGTIVSGIYVVVCLSYAYLALRRRDFGG